VQRRLAAILSADVQGYSRLMSENELATVQTLAASRRLITDVVESRRGRVVDMPGDNVLAEFGSAVDAVQAAIAMQTDLDGRNTRLPENRRMAFRIGVNLGGAHDPDVPLPETAITIAEAAGHVIDREAFLATLLAQVEHWIDRYVASGPPAVNAAWQDRMVKHLIARAEQIVGEVAGLDGDGALLLRDDAGQLHRVRSGDVVAVSC